MRFLFVGVAATMLTAAAACSLISGINDYEASGPDASMTVDGAMPVEGGAPRADAQSSGASDAKTDDSGDAGFGPDGSCGPLDTIENCGVCGRSCDTVQSVGAQCVGGDCTYTGCQAGWIDCDMGTPPNTNGCESSLTSTSTCGGCGNVCDTTHSVGASCERAADGGIGCVYSGCAPGYTDCKPAPPNTDGCETSLTSPSTCGGCGNVCDTINSIGASCEDGKTCRYMSCKSGFADCKNSAPDTDGCETPVASDSCSVCVQDGGCDTVHSNGGSCDVADGGGATCIYSGGCQSGYFDCNPTPPDTDGCETSLSTTSNCGKCGQTCDTVHSIGASCSNGGCLYTNCQSGWKDCTMTAPDTDGCETSLTSTKTCGGCKNACNTSTGAATCDGGTCAYNCNAGRSDCNGATAPDTDGCECATPTCCGASCATTHSNGVGESFYDCVATRTYNETQAQEACAAFAGSSPCTSSRAMGFCLFGNVSSVCGSNGSKCYCWQYSGHNAGTVQSENPQLCNPSCGNNNDPSWN